MADTLQDLALIIRSRFPIVQVETREETRIMKLLERVTNLENWPLFVWSIADGLKRVPRADTMTQTYEFQDVLRHIDKTPQNGVYTLLDAQPYFENPVNVRLIKEIAQEYYKTARTKIFDGAKLELPDELSRSGVTQHTELPQRNSRFTPESRSCSTLRYWRISQYSSCPTLRNVRHRSARSGVSRSLFEQ